MDLGQIVGSFKWFPSRSGKKFGVGGGADGDAFEPNVSPTIPLHLRQARDDGERGTDHER